MSSATRNGSGSSAGVVIGVIPFGGVASGDPFDFVNKRLGTIGACIDQIEEAIADFEESRLSSRGGVVDFACEAIVRFGVEHGVVLLCGCVKREGRVRGQRMTFRQREN